jgi:hypothetical protein
LANVTGAVDEVDVDENVVVRALAPFRESAILPTVTLDPVVPEADQRAKAAVEEAPTNRETSTATSAMRWAGRRILRFRFAARVTTRPAFRSP